ncbi:MAG: O-antigen ligase family protein [Deltaproteobacteria bacterium]|nr:O-antigen ligase family protein [Deltaproteobacteria bacterium]
MAFSKEIQIKYIDKIIFSCFIGLVFILPFAHTMSIRSVFMFLPAVLWFYKMALMRKVLFIKNPMTIPLAIFVVAAAVSLLTAVDPKYTLRELRGEMLADFLLFFLLLNNLHDRNQVEWIIASLLAGSLAHGIYGLTQYFSNELNLFDYNIKAWGFTAGFISYSVFLITVIPFNIYKLATEAGKKRLLAAILLILNLFMLYAVHQRGALIALIVQSLLFFWFSKRRLAFFLSLALIVLAITSLPRRLIYHGEGGIDLNIKDRTQADNTVNTRVLLWKFSLKEISRRPFTGIGFGRHSFSAKYKEFKGTELWHALNTFLNITLQLGVQGLAAFVFMLYRLIRTFWIGQKENEGARRLFYLAMVLCIIGFFVRNMFDDHYVDDNAQMLWVLMGVGMAVFLNIDRLKYRGLFREA